MGVWSWVKSKFRRKKETIKVRKITATKITGSKQTGGRITGTSKDVVTPSRVVSSGGGGGRSGGRRSGGAKQLGTIYVKPSEASQFKDKSKITVVGLSGSALSQVPSGDVKTLRPAKTNGLKTTKPYMGHGLDVADTNNIRGTTLSDNRTFDSNLVNQKNILPSQKQGLFKKIINLGGTADWIKKYGTTIGTIPSPIWGAREIDLFNISGKVKKGIKGKPPEEFYTQENLNIRINEFNKKWNKPEFIKEGTFVGSEKQYKDYTTGFQKVESWTKTYEEKRGVKEGGRYLGSVVRQYLPTTYEGIIFRGAEIYGGAKLLPIIGKGYAFIPTYAQVGLEGGVTAWNIKGFLDKDKSYPSRIMSGVFAGVGVTSLGMKSVSATTKALGYPKVQTSVVGVQQTTKPLQAGKQKIVTDVFFKSQSKKLFGTKTNYGISRSVSYAHPIGRGKYYVGETTTLGSFGKGGVKFPSGAFKIGDVKQFNVIQKGISTKAMITKSFTQKGFTISKEFPKGFKQFSLGKGVVGKDIIGKVPPKSKFYFVGGGGGYGKDPTTIFGKTKLIGKHDYWISPIAKEQSFKVLGQGKGSYQGLIFRHGKSPSTSQIKIISGGGKQSSPTFFNQLYQPKVSFPSEVIRNIQASTSAIASSEVSILPGLPIPPYLVGSGKQSLKLKPLVTPSIKLDEAITTSQEEAPRLVSGIKSVSRGRSKFVQAQIVTQTPAQQDKVTQSYIQSPFITQISKLSYGTSRGYGYGHHGRIPHPNKSWGFVPPILDLGFGDISKKRRIPIRKVVKYTPSYSAMVFKIFGKKPKGVETGLRIRPIPKGFSFAKMFGRTSFKRVVKIPKFTNLFPRRKRVIKKKRVKRR